MSKACHFKVSVSGYFRPDVETEIIDVIAASDGEAKAKAINMIGFDWVAACVILDAQEIEA